MSTQPAPPRSQSSTSLSRFYNGSTGSQANGNTAVGNDDSSDPSLSFCNAFWGTGDKGYEVVMARLRGAARTTDELKQFWRERAAIEEDYAKRLSKLSKFSLGRDEVGDLAASLQSVLAETAAQASYHLQVSGELHQTVEQPTAEFGNRLNNLKKGLQGSIEKSWRNKGLQEGHVSKARERYESDCLKLNSYTANASLVQGKELEKLQAKLDRVRQTIGSNEQDFRNFVSVLESTCGKWENEWRSFCDHVQDLEEDRLVLAKDLVWAYANAVSQVCVEDDSSCERIREKLEQFEPVNDMVNFVRGWGTGDAIPDPPRFINYSAGESYPVYTTFHTANFRRLSTKPPLLLPASRQLATEEQEPEIPAPAPETEAPSRAPEPPADSLQRLTLQEEPTPPPKISELPKAPFGGISLPGMTSPPSQTRSLATETKSFGDMPPPPVPPSMNMPEPRVPSRQGPPSPGRDIADEEDPMARALAELRRDPPGPGSVRRTPSHRRPDSISSSVRNSMYGQGIQPPASPVGTTAATHLQSYPAPAASQIRSSIDMGLLPPAGGHTAAALARSKAEFEAQSQTGKRQSVNYTNYADDVVGAHPSSRPASPSPSAAPRAPSPAMMQAPVQPATHIADEVLAQYHQAFPGERARSRAGSVASGRSRAGSFVGSIATQQAMASQQPPLSPREGFVGIGAGGLRSPSPQPPIFRSPSSSPVVSGGILGPQNLGISLDERGGVAHDSMAEAYRRQYQQQQQQQQQQQDVQRARPASQQYGYSPQTQASQPVPQTSSTFLSQQQSAPPKSPSASSYAPPSSASHGRPVSGYGAPAPAQSPASVYQPPTQQAYQPPSQQPTQAQALQYGQYGSQQQQTSYAPPQASPPVNFQAVGYPAQAQQVPQQQQYTGYYNGQTVPPQQPSLQTGAQVHPQAQSHYGYREPSPQPGYNASVAPPQPQASSYGHQGQSPQPTYVQRAPSPQPSYGHASISQKPRSPSPQPNMPPSNAQPTGQWSTTGLPVLFYVKALYDYSAQSSAEFDFQSGDIIAVTATPEDGWWSGELLDEARRAPGRTDFPSNFVCLF